MHQKKNVHKRSKTWKNTWDEYVEDVARDKLGLVYEGETVFKPSN